MFYIFREGSLFTGAELSMGLAQPSMDAKQISQCWAEISRTQQGRWVRQKVAWSLCEDLFFPETMSTVGTGTAVRMALAFLTGPSQRFWERVAKGPCL